MGPLKCFPALVLAAVLALGTAGKVGPPRWTPAVVRGALETAGATASLPEALTAARNRRAAIAPAVSVDSSSFAHQSPKLLARAAATSQHTMPRPTWFLSHQNTYLRRQATDSNHQRRTPRETSLPAAAIALRSTIV